LVKMCFTERDVDKLLIRCCWYKTDIPEDGWKEGTDGMGAFEINVDGNNVINEAKNFFASAGSEMSSE
jgi:hypothetical protein